MYCIDRDRPTRKADAEQVRLLIPELGTFPGDQWEVHKLFRKYWNININDVAVLSSPLMSSYHRRIVQVAGRSCIEICYNISETLSYVANNTSPLDSSPSISARGPTDMEIYNHYEPVYFRYDLVSGQTVYIPPKSKGDLRDLIHAIASHFEEFSQERHCVEEEPCLCPQEVHLHPLVLHMVIMFYVLSSRNTELNNLIEWLLWTETQLHQGSIFEIGDSDRFSRYIQLLHKMSRNLITLEHNNQRDASNIANLLRDHERLGQQAELHGAGIDSNSHERVRDDLLSLRDLCDDRHRRILNLQRRTNNFVTLLYNLITGHDSKINLQIATESAKIARDARKDSVSMKIIAGMTLLYLPATFVCSLFGTNLIALDTSTDGVEPAFVVSRLWWLYLVFALPLTALTMAGLLLWRRFREDRSASKGTILNTPRRNVSSTTLEDRDG